MASLIVGNAPIKGMGKKIDAFDNVIRINKGVFHLSDDVGWKMDTWGLRHMHDHRYCMPKEWADLKKYMLSAYPNLKIWVYNQGKPLKNWVNNIKREYGIFPTTGLLTILRAMIECEKPIYVTGFNFLDKSKPHHYWNKAPIRQSAFGRHKMGKEKKIFNEFIEKGTLIWMP